MLILPSRLLPRIVTSSLLLSGPLLHLRVPQPITLHPHSFSSYRHTAKAVCNRNMSGLEDLKFDNRALKSLPIDVETENYVRSVAG